MTLNVAVGIVVAVCAVLVDQHLEYFVMLIVFALVFTVINLHMLDIWTRELKEEAEHDAD